MIPNSFKSILIIFITSVFSCDQQKTDVTNHKIADLENMFPLPLDYTLISGDKVLDIIGELNILNNNSLTNKMNTKQTHFIEKDNIDKLISISNPVPKLEIEQSFLNGFAQMIEEETFNNLSKGSNHKLIEKKLLSANNNNKAFKVKFEYDSEKEKKYYTLFLITTKNQSFIISNFSNDKSDIQNMVAKYMAKTKANNVYN